MTRSHGRPSGHGPLWLMPAVLVLSACAGGAARAAEPGTARPPAPATVTDVAPVAGPSAAALPAPCSMVDASDVSLYVALATWDQTSGEQDGRAICQYSTNGFTVTTVTMRLADPASPPDGLCEPPGATPTTPPAEDLLCGYTGPTPDAATAVAARGGIAVGVRVVGPDAAHHATLLAQHALTHL
jgi:hypothetical protein